MPTAFFLYRSRTALTARSTQCAAILDEARARNAANALTGYLHCEDGFFYQWLEGPAEALAEVGAMIARDPRHHDLTYLRRGIQDTREFGDWQMGFGTSEPGRLFDWFAGHSIAVSDAGAYARGVLAFMHEAPRRTGS